MNILSFLRLTKEQEVKVRYSVVEQVKFGKSVRAIACESPFTTRTMYCWLVRYDLGGSANLIDRKRRGRPRKRTDEHADWISRVVWERTLEQFKFEFAFRTANRARIAFFEGFGVQPSVWTVPGIPRMFGLSAQRPKRRAQKYSAGNVEKWH